MSDSRFTGKRVLVTGATGFIGSHLVERLLAEGAEVAALARGKTAPWRLTHLLDSPSLSIIQCDLLSAEAVENAICRFSPSILYHCAAAPDKAESASQAHAVVSGNITATLHALEAFRRCNGELFVFTDSTKVYGNSPTPHHEETPVDPLCSYAVAKVAAWSFCELYRKIHNVASVCIRPTLIYGPRQGYNLINFVVDSLMEGKREITLMGGDQTRDPIYIDDAVEAFLAVATHEPEQVAGKIFNISGGTERSVRNITQEIADCMSKTVMIRNNANQARTTEICRSFCSIEAARHFLAWQPETDLQTGLHLTIEYLLAEHGKAATASA